MGWGGSHHPPPHLPAQLLQLTAGVKAGTLQLPQGCPQLRHLLVCCCPPVLHQRQPLLLLLAGTLQAAEGGRRGWHHPARGITSAPCISPSLASPHPWHHPKHHPVLSQTLSQVSCSKPSPSQVSPPSWAPRPTSWQHPTLSIATANIPSAPQHPPLRHCHIPSTSCLGHPPCPKHPAPVHPPMSEQPPILKHPRHCIILLS